MPQIDQMTQVWFQIKVVVVNGTKSRAASECWWDRCTVGSYSLPSLHHIAKLLHLLSWDTAKRLRESDLIVQFVDHFMVQLNLFDRNIESGFDKQFLSNSQFNQSIN